MRRPLLVLLALLLGAAASAPGARAAEPQWHSEQPVATGIGVPVPLGEVGEISFWAPNRGLLITAGTKDGSMPAGIYAYDGSGWYLYSTVCGGHGGSIAWASPDEFWTVADYGSPQEGARGPEQEWRRTLCHFKDGEVVASYGEPLAGPSAYSRMSAAACDGPEDCWFGGEALPPTAPNGGAFHLHWDGTSLSPVPSLTSPEPELTDPAGGVTGLVFHQGRLYESGSASPYVREVTLADAEVFHALALPAGAAGPFRLSSDEQGLWAVSSGGKVLRMSGGGFEAVSLERPLGEVRALGAEPGAASAWVGGASGPSTATVTQVSAGGAVGPTVTLPGAAEGLGPKGSAAQLACSAPGQCWMATEKGWLFHLGASLPSNEDPAMHSLITFRPCDDSCPSIPPVGNPEDDSGENEAKAAEEPLIVEKPPHIHRARALVVAVRRQLIHGTILELAFTLRARAHVRLLAKRHEKVVAETPRLTLAKGRHRLRLRLDPKQWPTGLYFQVHPAGGKRS